MLAGDEADLELARRHLAANVSELVVVAEVDDPRAVVEVAKESGASDVLLVTAAWLDEWYPRTIGRLDRLNVTTLLRVTGRETLFGLDRLREVGGLPFVLLLPQTMPTSQRHFKRLLDLFLLLLTAPVWVTLLGGVALYQLAVAGRPLLFRQVRVGVGGETFEMVKFRTMRPDAESDGVAQLSQRGRPARHPRLPLGARHPGRRAAADPAHRHRQDVDRRPAAGAPRAHQGVREGDRRVHPAARGAAGPDRPGARSTAATTPTPSTSWATTCSTS